MSFLLELPISEDSVYIVLRVLSVKTLKSSSKVKLPWKDKTGETMHSYSATSRLLSTILRLGELYKVLSRRVGWVWSVLVWVFEIVLTQSEK